MEAPTGRDKTRPTSAKVREALMSIIAPYLEDSVFIDLFAGSGAVGIEALSRGAGECLFVERDRKALGALKKNLKTVAEHFKKQSLPAPKVTVFPLDLESSQDSIKARIARQAHIVWADPPYQNTLSWLAKSEKMIGQLTLSHGFFIVECEKGQLTGGELESSHWELVKIRHYGQTSLVVWQKKKDTSL